MSDVLKDVTRDEMLKWAEHWDIQAETTAEVLAKETDNPFYDEMEACIRRDRITAALLRGLVALYNAGLKTPEDRNQWIARDSVRGRGMRLHQTSDAQVWGASPYPTPWAALSALTGPSAERTDP